MSETAKFSLLVPQTTLLPAKTVNSGKDFSGSATGNPRNKCALKPGHSLMDWIRLGNSGADLSGTKGAVRQVTSRELVKHRTQDDAWMAIRGKVYNVTRYLDFHPGGIDEIMKGVGRDATKMFDEVHAWVNYEQLLAKCYIGPLRIVASPEAKPVPLFLVPEEIEINPRFDWIQKSSEITLTFYTKAFCNPGLIVSRLSQTEMSVTVLIERTSHLYKFKLFKDVNWPCKVSLSSQTGKIDIVCSKSTSEVWSTYGSFVNTKKFTESSKFDCIILKNTKFNHDSFVTVTKSEKDILICPVGHHFTLSSSVKGEEISRNYTPVHQKYSESTLVGSNCNYFLIKSYDNGLLAKHLTGLEEKSQIYLSQPKGALNLVKLLSYRKFGLIAAGSGFTPILSVLDHLMARSTNRVELFELFLFNKSEEDIWCKEQLSGMSENDERLKVRHVLSQPDKTWTGETGRISEALVASLLDKTSPSYINFFFVCGPPAFNDLVEKILFEASFDSKNVHFFRG